MRANRDQILRTLSDHHHELVQRFGVKHLALFGSAARDELHDDSDVDVLVDYEGPVTYDGYFKLQDYLQALLGRSVDRSRSLAFHFAIAHVRHAEVRLRMLFSHLADRWGRVTA